MNAISNLIQLQFKGYLNTPPLWTKQEVFGLKQLHLSSSEKRQLKNPIPEEIRVGKRIERFVSDELEQINDIHILLKNKQIQQDKRTIGEIDCILEKNGVPIHLEIVFKFYLYDPVLNQNELAHWIGPNRNDTLLKKLTKLKDKQLPLIFNNHAKPVLESLTLNKDKILQRVLFKAQLFVPYRAKVDFQLLNKDCLKGFYIHKHDIANFSDCEFYIPNKMNWLLDVHSDVQWLGYKPFIKAINILLQHKKAPLCWVKFPEGKLEKFFVVWWS